jgi:predicted NAD-dependent protein-ADP-ribosyltransferase YbiA (DUF1768 family)
VEQIAEAASPEEAARIGRQAERSQPSLLRPDWATAKLAVMYAGLRAKVRPARSPPKLYPSCRSRIMDMPSKLMLLWWGDLKEGGGPACQVALHRACRSCGVS